MISFENRVAIVTGAGRGLGRAIATQFSKYGASVIVAEVGDVDGEAVASEIRADGGTAEFVRTDVTDTDSWASLVSTTEQKFGKVDILVNNAGISVHPKRDIAETAPDAFDRTLAVNLKGVWLGMHHVIPSMLPRGGSIVNIASVMGLVGVTSNAAYVASKHGVIGLTKAAALEYGMRGIRVNAICPGNHETPLMAMTRDRFDTQAWEQRVKLNHPATGRIGTPEELAAAVLFLSSDMASNIHGVALPVDGGWVAH